MYMSSQQWDFPNAWPPLQAFIILGLLMTGEVNANRVAYQMAQIWLRSNFRGFDFSQSMYEKVRFLLWIDLSFVITCIGTGADLGCPFEGGRLNPPSPFLNTPMPCGLYNVEIIVFQYDVMNAGRTGKGGEYETQFGFGWTNGVVFEILNRWGSSLFYYAWSHGKLTKF